MNVATRLTAAIASAAIIMSAATVAADAAAPAASAISPAAASFALTPARLKNTIYTIVPPIAEKMQLDGTADVRIDIDEAGRAKNAVVIVSTGNAILDAAAIKTALSAKYEPATIGGTPVAGSFLITVDFHPSA